MRGIELDVKKIQKLITQGKYELSKHAEKERQVDMIHMRQLEEALRGCEIRPISGQKTTQRGGE